MNSGRIQILGWLVAATIQLAAQPLFDGALGTLPSQQGWLFFAARGLAEESHTGSAAHLVTTVDNGESAGYALVAPVALARDPGFNVAFRIRLTAETHARLDRAGFSVIVLAEDRLGIELGFWTNLVFAQSSEPLFTHAEEASFDFTAGFVDLVLRVAGTHYTLFVDRTPLLSGTVHDYSAFTGFPDVYETPNLLFLGDNTTSAAANVEIAAAALVPAPALRVPGSDRIEWDGIPGQTYTVESSPGLDQWTAQAQVRSATTRFSYTNVVPVAQSLFLRLSYP